VKHQFGYFASNKIKQGLEVNLKFLTVQCPHCLQLVKIADGQTTGTQVRWDCPQCETVISLPCTPSHLPQPASPPIQEAPLTSAVPSSTMPQTQPEQTSPSKNLPVGLAQALEVIASESAAGRSMKNAFVRLYENTWRETDAHQKFLQIANQQNALALAGKLYGAVLQSLPEDEMAMAGREKVLQLGMAQLGHLRAAAPIRSRSFTPKKWLIIGGLIFVLLVFSMLFVAVQSLFSGGPTSLN
tara:strand:- start:2733 stop:3458 length:726 start_codon:yes stop_codon:yes gene_type:complete